MKEELAEMNRLRAARIAELQRIERDAENSPELQEAAHDAKGGHEVKSRAENNSITNSRLQDGTADTSYQLDLAPDFPHGSELHVLREMRDAATAKGTALGLRFVGCGVGCDGADTQFDLGGDKWLSVRITIEDKP